MGTIRVRSTVCDSTISSPNCGSRPGVMRSVSIKKTTLCLLLIVVLGSVRGTYAQTVDLAFEKKLPGWMKETNVPAVGIGIIENGKITYTKVFGELRKAGPT